MALIAAAIGPFAIQYLVSGPALFSVFTYHSGRGIQIESLYASLMTLAAVFGLEISVNHSHGAYELDGALAPLLKMCSTVALVGFLLAAGLWALAQKSRFTRDDAYRLAAFVPAAAIILANVLSPQYFVWALPLLILVGAEILPESKMPMWIFSAAVMAVAALTTWVFPYHYLQTAGNSLGLLPLGNAADSTPGAVASALVCVRNAIYLTAIVAIGVRLVRLKQRLAAALPPDHRPLTGVH
jgi:hypothetical protein